MSAPIRLRALLLCASLGVLAACGPAAPRGDAARGAKIHEGCVNCHGTEIYTKAERKIKSFDALRKDVVRWGDYYAPALSEQDVDDVTAYLNRDFYKF